jgi:3-oxoacyl-[acyl-carrier protein] reductase
VPNLETKVVLVTGASKGIGSGIAKAMANAGASVVVNYLSSRSAAQDVVLAINQAGGKATSVQGDVSRAEDCRRIIEAALSSFGRLDCLVNNSGVYHYAPLGSITEDDFHRQFSVNVFGLLMMTQAAVPHLPPGSTIINIGSLVSRLTPSGSAVYSATKAAVDAITGVLAKELGPAGIRVNSINPGLTETEGTRAAGFIGTDKEIERTKQSPLNRIGQPKDIGDIAAFLASAESAWLTGEILIASGGVR